MNSGRFSLLSLAQWCLFPLGVLALLAVNPKHAEALPQGGEIVQGNVQFQTQGSDQLHILQRSDRAIINWQSFGIDAHEWVNFIQPSSTAAALNRVTGNTPSSIAGRLTANGQVFLINPNGIAFLPSSQVDVSGLVASTLNLSDGDFLAGRYSFHQVLGKPPTSIVNQGNISIKDGGFAALIAPAVKNSGVIAANLGKVFLGSGTAATLDLYGDGLLSVTVDPQLAGQITDLYGTPLNALIDNSGTIRTPGGKVLLAAQAAGQIVDSVINISGTIEARHAENRNGTIVLSGGNKGVVAIHGLLDVGGLQGGTVQVTGENIGLFGTAKIDASGDQEHLCG
ncbi:MAG: filamentous hemagglutinin N-terminal domain-containing protein [Thermosynechococcus sp.]